MSTGRIMVPVNGLALPRHVIEERLTQLENEEPETPAPLRELEAEINRPAPSERLKTWLRRWARDDLGSYDTVASPCPLRGIIPGTDWVRVMLIEHPPAFDPKTKMLVDFGGLKPFVPTVGFVCKLSEDYTLSTSTASGKAYRTFAEMWERFGTKEPFFGPRVIFHWNQMNSHTWPMLPPLAGGEIWATVKFSDIREMPDGLNACQTISELLGTEEASVTT